MSKSRVKRIGKQSISSKCPVVRDFTERKLEMLELVLKSTQNAIKRMKSNVNLTIKEQEVRIIKEIETLRKLNAE